MESITCQYIWMITNSIIVWQKEELKKQRSLFVQRIWTDLFKDKLLSFLIENSSNGKAKTQSPFRTEQSIWVH
jgi:hypothetical protein